ncbi:MAG: prohibitin family protein [Clostridia bacterium]|nr:prohibitin family protein [Clostridia bacterium]MBR2953254.1 prohibitin family protein [Clostridia bacterium]
MDTKKIVKIAIIAVCAIVVVGVAISCFTVVQAGHTGVVLTFGAVEDTELEEGLHFKIPFIQRVVQMNNRTQKIETEGSSSSKDLQIISYVVAVNYHVNDDSSASLYQNVGTDYGSVVIVPAIQESIKAVTAQYTAEELITKRQTVGEQIKDALSEKINQYGITVEIFNIVDFDFSEEFNAAVEAKQTAQQNALKAEQDLARIEVEAQQKITQAEAEAESIRLIQEALAKSPDYVDYIKWNKWNGELPTVMGDSDILLNMDALKSE